MKIVSVKRKWICLLLIYSMIFQSCSVYKNKSVTMDEAVAKSSKVKMTRTDGRTDIFDQIEKTDTLYYGVIKSNGENSRKPINRNDYVKIQPKNKPLSTLATVGVIVVPLIAIVGLLQIIDLGNGY